MRGKKIFATQFKYFSIFILVSGVYQIISGYSKKKESNVKIINSNKSNPTKIIDVKLEENAVFNINLDIVYSTEKGGLFIPKKSDSYITGLNSGYRWEFHAIDVSSFKVNEKSNFTATGVLNWNLFGINIYKESKIFKGTVE